MEKRRRRMIIATTLLALAVLMLILVAAPSVGFGMSEPFAATPHDYAEVYDSGNVSPPGSTVLQANVSMDGLFVKFGDIEGESTDGSYRGWSRAITFEQGQILPDAGGVTIRARGDALAEPFVIVKELDKASPKLAEAVFKAIVLPKVEIHLTTTQASRSRVSYYSYELRNVVTTGYHIGGNEYGGTRPVEIISLTFEEIKDTYVEYDAFGNARGTVGYSFDTTGG